jgi:hypothetical protein
VTHDVTNFTAQMKSWEGETHGEPLTPSQSRIFKEVGHAPIRHTTTEENSVLLHFSH